MWVTHSFGRGGGGGECVSDLCQSFYKLIGLQMIATTR